MNNTEAYLNVDGEVFSHFLECDMTSEQAQKLANQYKNLKWHKSVSKEKTLKTVNCLKKTGHRFFYGENRNIEIIIKHCNPWDDAYTVLAKFMNSNDAMLYKLTYSAQKCERFHRNLHTFECE